jgi:ABC-type multidrug transport system ATPase subunit
MDLVHVCPQVRAYVEQVIDTVDLTDQSFSLVGLPGAAGGGLSTEQLKRLTIAVELVANPSVVFMDEPSSGVAVRLAMTMALVSLLRSLQARPKNPAHTVQCMLRLSENSVVLTSYVMPAAHASGLDGRAAAIVMSAVRNVASSGRTVMVTIHQPSIEIFEAFDTLLLLQVCTRLG